MLQGVLNAQVWLPVLTGSLALNFYFLISSVLQPTTSIEHGQLLATPTVSVVHIPTALNADAKPQLNTVAADKKTEATSTTHGVLCPKEKADTLVADVSTGSTDESKSAVFPGEGGQAMDLKRLVEWYAEQNRPAERFYVNPFSR